jgi:hypothetical protein
MWISQKNFWDAAIKLSGRNCEWHVCVHSTNQQTGQIVRLSLRTSFLYYFH